MASSEASFLEAWNEFHHKAQWTIQHARKDTKRAAAPHQHVLRIQSILKSLACLVSKNKELPGALVLAVQAAESILFLRQTVDADSVVRMALKAIRQICVGPSQRAQCRSVGVFRLCSSILATADNHHLDLLQDTYTTVALVCLGNDLNALHASIVIPLPTLPTTASPQYQRTIAHLQALFRIIRKEQERLLQFCSGEVFFSKIETAEHEYAQGNYTTALDEIQSLVPHTDLLDDLLLQILNGRSSTSLSRQKWNDVLDDVRTGLEILEKSKNSNSSLKAVLEDLRAKALKGRFLFAQQALVIDSNPSMFSKEQLKRRQVGVSRRRRRPYQYHAWDTRHQPEEDEEEYTLPTRPGACVKSFYGTGTILQVRECGTVKIQLDSFYSDGMQQPTAYLRPELYTIVSGGTCITSLYGRGTILQVRECGTAKIQLESFYSDGRQQPTAYFRPELYTIVSE